MSNDLIILNNRRDELLKDVASLQKIGGNKAKLVATNKQVRKVESWIKSLKK